MSTPRKQSVGGETPSLRGMRVLVVEDTWHVAQALKSVLEQMGMDVFGPAATTAAARRLAAEHTPSIAVVDVNLGGEHVYPVARALRERGIPFMFATGYGERRLPSEFEGERTLQKPYIPKSVDTHLSALLGG